MIDHLLQYLLYNFALTNEKGQNRNSKECGENISRSQENVYCTLSTK